MWWLDDPTSFVKDIYDVAHIYLPPDVAISTVHDNFGPGPNFRSLLSKHTNEDDQHVSIRGSHKNS